MYSKILTLYLTLVILDNVVALTNSQKRLVQAKFITSGFECIKDYPLSKEDIRNLKAKIMPEKENVKCFTNCLLKKINLMDEKGMLSSTSAKQSAKQCFQDDEEALNNVEKFVAFCAPTVNSADVTDKRCERAKLAFNCLWDNAKKFGYDVNF